MRSLKPDTERLKFTFGNAKLSSRIAILSLPTGHTCPGAKECLAKVPREGGKLIDGPQQLYRCYAAMMESAFASVRNQRWRNFDLINEHLRRSPVLIAPLVEVLVDSLAPLTTRQVDHVRLHGGGDFFSQRYFDAWMQAMMARPDLHFYSYTKSLHLIKNWGITRGLPIPQNFKIIASLGGKFDALYKELNLKTALVVMHPKDAKARRLEIDHDDSHAYKATKNFALLLHGGQPPGSAASAALRRMDQEEIEYSYSKR